jgi:tRNA nucleotidyltransferase/poly(A) polymerase
MEKTARQVAAHLREQGNIAYFAGGCVRDMVRGLTPKDYDIATDARPETVQALFPRTYAVGAHFGVIIVLEDGFQFEVATFRSDDAYIDGGTQARCIFPRRKQTRSDAISPLTECFTIRSQVR